MCCTPSVCTSCQRCPDEERPPCCLSILDIDAILEIIELLPTRELKRFSATCKWLRQVCKPYLFANAHINVDKEVFTGDIFQTSSDVWLYTLYRILAPNASSGLHRHL
ncbi:hypothetical protein PYCCODRAFT_423641 [Trametes coccinea BRFM310]|uniref:F-box domain-containing protein n=1 Tax=Trametes coccinea (strain BRFM310) TaxID=1353009 RepID=A0A1Y2INS5_TRAC3|nr:hypothetical protein PYCCODRAFT_423641 [Trametes coccinea BRFM310]